LYTQSMSELAGKACKRLLGASHLIVEIFSANTPQHAAQGIGLRDHVMVGEGLDLERAPVVFRHVVSLRLSALNGGAGFVEQRGLLKHFDLAADAAFGPDIGVAAVAPPVRSKIGLGFYERARIGNHVQDALIKALGGN